MSAHTYKFSLARVLQLRDRRERDAAVTLAAARSAEDALRAVHDSAAARLADARAAMLPAPGQTRGVAELLNAAFLTEQLSARTVVATEQLLTAQWNSAKCAAQLAERVRDRRILERLRDREHASWATTQARRDREEMDSVAQTRERMARQYSTESTQ